MPTTITTINTDLKDLITEIASADIIKIEGSHFIMPDINAKGATLEQLIESLYDKEDYEIVFKAGDVEFVWWDIREESQRMGDGHWMIYDKMVKFITLQQ